MHLENAITIATPVDRVWDLTIDIERWPTLTPTILSVERIDDGELRVGSSARVRQPRMPLAVWTVTELEPLSRFVWEARILGSRFVGGHHLTSTSDGTRNALTLDVSGCDRRPALSRRRLDDAAGDCHGERRLPSCGPQRRAARLGAIPVNT